ncbi:DUF4468 domain-containing protein, partial [Jiulongibacter sediminis]|uniref:DUF4468 domain-containing protein n=1 Tax=Jiulongibacter sediminis TaxID=1605367 RepID=UPI0026EBA3A3
MNSFKVILIALLIHAIPTSGQDAPNEYKPIKFTEVVKTDKAKREIYLATRLWFYKNFSSYKGVISVDDFENGIIYAKGKLPTNYFRKGENMWKNSGVIGDLNFNLRVYYKDGVYKIIFDDLIHEQYSNVTGVTTEVGFGLLKNNPIYADDGKFMSKAQNRDWN